MVSFRTEKEDWNDIKEEELRADNNRDNRDNN